MSAPVAVPLLEEEHAAFVQGSVSIAAASRDVHNVPSIGRMTGCRVAVDRRRVTVYAAASQVPQLLTDIRSCGRIAVVFSRPSTNRSFQLKSDDAVVRPLVADELAVISRYAQAFAIEIAPLGHGAEHARALFMCVDDDLIAIDFTPNAAFEQTPGPSAGKAIPLGQ